MDVWKSSDGQRLMRNAPSDDPGPVQRHLIYDEIAQVGLNAAKGALCQRQPVGAESVLLRHQIDCRTCSFVVLKKKETQIRLFF